MAIDDGFVQTFNCPQIRMGTGHPSTGGPYGPIFLVDRDARTHPDAREAEGCRNLNNR